MNGRPATDDISPVSILAQRQANGCPRLACSCSFHPFRFPAMEIMGHDKNLSVEMELCLAAQMKLATMEG